MNDLIAKTVELLRRSASSTDDEVRGILVTDGVETTTAARLIEFLPMAYCRLLLEPSGVRLSSNFRRRLEDGQLSEERPLTSQPVWNAVLEYARNDVVRGVSPEDLLAVAGRSAEFDAANQLLKNGSQLKNIVLTPVVLLWAESLRS
jgi:hypothetical protein